MLLIILRFYDMSSGQNNIQTRPSRPLLVVGFLVPLPQIILYFKTRPLLISCFIVLRLATMMLVRHDLCYYLCSFQKIASHGSYDEMYSTESTLNTNTTITNITTIVVPFAPPTAWDLWIRPIGRA